MKFAHAPQQGGERALSGWRIGDGILALLTMLSAQVLLEYNASQVTDGTQCWQVCNGVAMLQAVTATGCSLKAVMAAFASAVPDRRLEATVAALAVFGCVHLSLLSNGQVTLRGAWVSGHPGVAMWPT